MFTLCCSPRAREFPRCGHLCCTMYSYRATGPQSCQFSDFGLFFPYKTPKTYLPVTSLQPRGYIAEWLRFFYVVVEGPKGCLPAAMFSYDFWWGAEDPRTCRNFRLWQMAVPMHNATTWHIRLGPKMPENAQFWRWIYFPTKFLHAYPQNHPKTPFWKTFNAQLIIHWAVRKSHINGATKLKLHSYIGIGKYLGEWVCQNFSAISPWQTTANICKTAFSLHVIESASDDYNF